MSDELTVVYRAASLEHAQQLKEELKRQGFVAFISHDSISAAEGQANQGWDSAPRVLVANGDAAAASRIVAGFEEQLRASANARTAENDDRWEDWPCCPKCSRPRQTRCEFCHTAGTTFPLADLIPATQIHRIGANPNTEPEFDDNTVLLMCDTCDEPFAPQFYRRCVHCGHDFGDGLQFEEQTSEPLTSRTILVVFLMIASLVVLLLWAVS